MRVALLELKLRGTAKGIVKLRLRCTGNALARCRGQSLLELGNAVVGFKSFSLAPTGKKGGFVSVKLKRDALASLRASGRLRLDVTITVRSGVAVVAGLTTKQIVVLPPQPRR